MKASDSTKVPFVVTEEPQPTYPGVPLPDFYWTRPIDAQAQEWSGIAGNFLYHAISTDQREGTVFLPYTNETPATSHVLWRRNPGAMGGLVGGESGVHSFEDGTAYEGKFTAFIIGGILYRNAPWPSHSHYQSVTAIDLKTGEELWTKNGVRITYAQTLYWDTMNYHGVYGYLWDTSGSGGKTWKAYDAYSGEWWYTMTDVPSGIVNYGPNGEILIYTLNLNKGWMTKWNSTSVEYNYYVNLYNKTNPEEVPYWAGRWRPYGLTLNATLGYDYNKTIPTNLPGAVSKVCDEIILGSNRPQYGQDFSKPTDTATYWAISTKKGQEGQLLWTKSHPVSGNVSYIIKDVNEEEGIFVETSRDTRQWTAYSLTTGDKLWGPTDPQPMLDWVGFAQISWVDVIAYGKLYSGSFSGTMHCYDIKTGQLLWNYTAKDEFSESLMGTNWCLGIMRIADGKVYIAYHEHSYFNPKPRAAPTFCLDAETGELLWKMDMCTSYRDSFAIIGDGVFVILNSYDNNDYAIAKGPSATTVTANPKTSVFGSSVQIEGMVTDISPGTRESVLPMRFPNGVPAVSDASMSDWMQHVYMQFPRPSDVKGVDVILSVLDANGNFREIGKTTSNSAGFFTFNWKPDIEGQYTVYASFAGSESYYPSQAVTSFAVDPAPAIETSTDTGNVPTYPPIETYLLGATAAIIIAIAIVGILMLRKRA
jgi:hypothetical protein